MDWLFRQVLNKAWLFRGLFLFSYSWNTLSYQVSIHRMWDHWKISIEQLLLTYSLAWFTIDRRGSENISLHFSSTCNFRRKLQWKVPISHLLVVLHGHTLLTGRRHPIIMFILTLNNQALRSTWGLPLFILSDLTPLRSFNIGDLYLSVIAIWLFIVFN